MDIWLSLAYFYVFEVTFLHALSSFDVWPHFRIPSQPAIKRSKLIIETPEQGVKYVQS